jgi:hypothetical protein
MSKHAYTDLSFTALPTSACDEVFKNSKDQHVSQPAQEFKINIINHPVAEKYLQHENHLKNETQIFSDFGENRVKVDGK